MKKFREESGQFIAEGHKLVFDLIHSKYEISAIYAIPDWIRSNSRELEGKSIPVLETSPTEMNRISALSTPSQVLAVVKMETHPLTSSPTHQLTNSLSLALDDIHDPGNMGTIIRIADWFGIGRVICSENMVDLYNPKVVQATMGSLARVHVSVTGIANHLSRVNPGTPVFGTFMDGENIYTSPLPSSGIIVIGNESAGISEEISSFITRRIHIPLFADPAAPSRPESLNAAIATAVVCSEFRRRRFPEE